MEQGEGKERREEGRREEGEVRAFMSAGVRYLVSRFVSRLKSLPSPKLVVGATDDWSRSSYIL